MSIGPDPGRMKTDLARLVGLNTENPPGGEHAAAELVGGLLREAGFDVALDSYAPGRTNVVARMTRGDGPCLAFNTHMDVVPAGDGWTLPPFQLTERDGRLYGRGACDAKGPLIAMVEALRMLADSADSWRGTLLGVFVADEEVASEGARHFAAGRPAIDYVVVGEPTENGTIIAHKGSLRPLVRVHGVAAHSGTPDLGDNAVYRAAGLVGLVERLHRDVVSRLSHPLVGNASLTITRMNAGIGDNIVPAHCDLLLDRRMIPGEDEEVVKAEIAALLDEARQRFGVRAEILAFKPTTGGAAETPADHPIVAASLEAGRRHGARAEAPGGFTGACDLVHFRGIGAYGSVLGPGSLAVAHKPDEFVPVDEFVAASLIYRDIATRMLPRA